MIRHTFRRALAAAAALVAVSCASAGVAQAAGPLGGLPLNGLIPAGLPQLPQVGALLPAGA